MATPGITLRNAGDLRLENPEFVYNQLDKNEQDYIDNLETLALYKSNIVPVEQLESTPKLQNYLQQSAEERASEITSQLNRFNITGQEQEILTYDPALLNVPSFRNPGTVREDFLMTKVSHTDPPEGKNIAFNKRSPGLSIPVFLDMVDTNFNRQGIFLGNELIATTLKLNPNPDTLTINSSKKVNRYTTMTRWVEEHWGDDPDTITFSGSTFSFYGYDTDAGHVGLTSVYRDQTAAYKFLKALQKFFQVNGMIYQSETDYEGADLSATAEFLANNPEFRTSHPRRGMIKERLYLRLNFDYAVFIGRFESFDIIEDSENPYRILYNAIFKAEKTMYRLDKAPDRGASTSSSSVVPADRGFNNTLAMSGAFV